LSSDTLNTQDDLLLKNDFVEFSKVHWLHFTGEVVKYVTLWCRIFLGFPVLTELLKK